MLRSIVFSRHAAALSLLVPFAFLTSACSDDAGTSQGNAGKTGSGGKASGGSVGSSGDAAGGRTASGGALSGGAAGGDSNGGRAAGGDANGGDASGGDGEAGSAGGPDIIPASNPAPVLLGAAGDYVILAESAISNVPTSVVTGNLGLSPAAASYITGFSLTRAGTMWTAPQVVGGVFAADNDAPTPSALTTAVADMHTAYTDAAGRPTPAFLNLGGGAIGGMTLGRGLYKWTSTVTIPANVTLAGAPDDVWIFQITGDLTMSAAKSMMLSGRVQAKNIFWQVTGTVDLGGTSHAEGVILSKTAIKLGAGASINGRLLAQTAVNIASSTVTAP